MYMATIGQMVTCTPLCLRGLGELDQPLDHWWGQLDSILGHQVAPHNYGGSAIELDHVSGGQYSYYHVQG